MTAEESIREALAAVPMAAGRYKLLLEVEVDDGVGVGGRDRPPHAVGAVDLDSSGVRVGLSSSRAAREARSLLEDDLLDIRLDGEAVHLLVMGAIEAGEYRARETARAAVASIRLVDARTRVVELLGPLPPGSRRPVLLFEGQAGRVVHAQTPSSVASCIGVDDRRAKFLVDKTAAGDEFLDLLGQHHKTPVRPAKPYGVRGYLVGG